MGWDVPPRRAGELGGGGCSTLRGPARFLQPNPGLLRAGHARGGGGAGRAGANTKLVSIPQHSLWGGLPRCLGLPSPRAPTCSGLPVLGRLKPRLPFTLLLGIKACGLQNPPTPWKEKGLVDPGGKPALSLPAQGRGSRAPPLTLACCSMSQLVLQDKPDTMPGTEPHTDAQVLLSSKD